MVRSLLVIIALVTGLGALPGCSGFSSYFWNDTPPAYQRYQIQRRDPYPENDIGPPMVGVRPPGFDQPAPEPVRARWKENPDLYNPGY